jgi:hypothetical protein
LKHEANTTKDRDTTPVSGPDSPPPGDNTPTPTTSGQHVLLTDALDQLAETMEVAIATLKRNREMVMAASAALGSTRRVADLAARARMSDLREGLSTALHELDLARGRARLAFFRELQSDGHSIREIGDMWGISRQLASRVLRDG